MTSYQAYGSRQDSNNDTKTSSDFLNSYPYPPNNTFESSRVSPSKFTPEYQDDDELTSPLSSLPFKGNMKMGNSKEEVVVDMRAVSRTPSPTPSEAAELKKGFFDLKAMKNWRYWIRKEWTCASLSFRCLYYPLSAKSFRQPRVQAVVAFSYYALFLRVLVAFLVLNYFGHLGYYIIGIIVVVAVTLFTVYHEQIVRWLQPHANKIHE